MPWVKGLGGSQPYCGGEFQETLWERFRGLPEFVRSFFLKVLAVLEGYGPTLGQSGRAKLRKWGNGSADQGLIGPGVLNVLLEFWQAAQCIQQDTKKYLNHRHTYIRVFQGSWTKSGKKKDPNPNFRSGYYFRVGWGSSTWRGGGQKVRYVFGKPGKPNFLPGYPGILLGYPGGARKVREKKVCVQFSSSKKGGDKEGGEEGKRGKRGDRAWRGKRGEERGKRGGRQGSWKDALRKPFFEINPGHSL